MAEAVPPAHSLPSYCLPCFLISCLPPATHPCPASCPGLSCPHTPALQAYPEFCRQVFDAAPLGFQIAVAELQNKYGKVRCS